MSEEKRAAFHIYLQQLGYDVPPDSHALRALFDLYRSCEWGEMVETEFAPVWVWNAKTKALLAPFLRISL